MVAASAAGIESILGSLSSYMDFSSILNFGTTWVHSKVIMGFFSGYLAQREMLYTSIIFMLLTTYIASGYVAVHAVDAAVDSTKGYYSNYGGFTTQGNNLMIYETFFVVAFLFWSIVQIILVTVFATNVWDAVDARLAEAEEGHTGLEEPLSWWLAMKTMALTHIVAIMMMIVGYAMGDIQDELLDWFNEYEGKTSRRGTDDDGWTEIDSGEDFLMHGILAAYGMFVFGTMGLASYIFGWSFLNLSEDNLECDVEGADLSVYAPAFAAMKQIVDKETCLANIQVIFDVMDLDHNNLLSRCEDAIFQHAHGSSAEYAKKFSSIYTRAAANMICNEYDEDHYADEHHDHDHI